MKAYSNVDAKKIKTRLLTEGKYIILPNFIIDSEELSVCDKALYTLLMRMSNVGIASIAQMSAQLKVSRSTLHRSLLRLEHFNLISVKRTPRGNRYLLEPKPSPEFLNNANIEIVGHELGVTDEELSSFNSCENSFIGEHQEWQSDVSNVPHAKQANSSGDTNLVSKAVLQSDISLYNKRKNNIYSPCAAALTSITTPDEVKEISPVESIDVVVDYWNSKTKLSKVVALSASRKVKLAKRMKEEYFRLNWREAIDKIASTPFLTGDNDRKWRASFDWFIENDSNYIKAVEGIYGKAKVSDEWTPLI